MSLVKQTGSTRVHKFELILLEIAGQMKALSLWSAQKPTAEQLASVEPFCVDSLSFAEWLQFIFLPRMKQTLEQDIDFPKNSQIAPMAEQCFAHNGVDASGLIAAIKDFDILISEVC